MILDSEPMLGWDDTSGALVGGEVMFARWRDVESGGQWYTVFNMVLQHEESHPVGRTYKPPCETKPHKPV